MANNKKLVEAITSMEDDFAQWYTDVVKKAELCGYTSVKGCMAIKPAGYAIWENIQHELDRRFKETGVQNVYMPIFIPESLLQKEKDHVEGFAPEVAWVAEEAEERTIQMLNLYADFCEEVHAIPVIKGQKTDKEKFSGAEATYTIESLMHDGKALQSGTSHNFGDGFARAFGIQYTDKENKLQYVHQTSWGMTTRMIGAIIMVHGDNSGLVLPPRIAPVQAVIIPIQQRKECVLEKADEMFAALKAAGVRVKVDDTDKSPGFKFAEQEMRGIPIRIECGPKDIENGQAVICRRDTREKYTVTFDELVEKVQEILETIQKDMLERARKHRDSHTYVATNYEEFKDTIVNKPGFVKAMWCGDRACEDKIKEDVQATSRCMPFEQEHLSDVCVCCGKPAKKMVYWGRAY